MLIVKNERDKLNKLGVIERIRMQTAGFSLIELITVIILVSVIAAVGLINFPSSAIFQAKGFADMLSQDLLFTKILSMSKNQRYRIVIGANSYQIQDQNSNPIIHPGTTSATTAYPTGLTVTPTTTVIFDSLGAPYNGSNTALSSTLTLSVSASGVVNTISVTPQTGLIQ